jgi:F0F1-type ATP synthase membrane subunit b/b'
MFLAMMEGGAGWWARAQPYLDYPGFEAWKFFNLAIFVVLMVYALTRKFKLGDAFQARRESIKLELAKARDERDAALAKLKEVEDRLALLDQEVAAIKERSVQEAAAERARIAQSTEAEIAKLGEQAQREIESTGKAAKKDLRRYAAEQSVRLAEVIVRRELRPEDDARLIANNIEELGGPAQ